MGRTVWSDLRVCVARLGVVVAAKSLPALCGQLLRVVRPGGVHMRTRQVLPEVGVGQLEHDTRLLRSRGLVGSPDEARVRGCARPWESTGVNCFMIFLPVRREGIKGSDASSSGASRPVDNFHERLEEFGCLSSPGAARVKETAASQRGQQGYLVLPDRPRESVDRKRRAYGGGANRRSITVARVS